MASDHSYSEETVNNSSSEWNFDLITPGIEYPLEVPKKPKRFWSGAKKFMKKKKVVKQIPGESSNPKNFHDGIQLSNSATSVTNNSSCNTVAHGTDLKESILSSTRKRNQVGNKSKDKRHKMHNSEYDDVRRQDSKLGSIDKKINSGTRLRHGSVSNEDKEQSIGNSSITEHITQSEVTSDHSATLKDGNLVETSPSSSCAPITENILISLQSCQLNNLVDSEKPTGASSETYTLLKPETASTCPAQPGTQITHLKEPVNEKPQDMINNNGVLESIVAFPSTCLSPNVLSSLENPKNVQNKTTDVKESAVLKNPELRNAEVENAISNQSISMLREDFQGEVDIFDIKKAQFYAHVLRNLQEDQRREVKKEIAGVLIHSQISAGTFLDKTHGISIWHGSNQLPYVSNHKESDIFDATAQSYINVLRNLPKEKLEEVNKDVSDILMQAQIAETWEKSQKNVNSDLTRKPLKVIIKPSQKQGSLSPRNERDGSQLPPKDRRLYPTLTEAEWNGDGNEQEFEDSSYGQHQSAATYRENEGLNDDASEEEVTSEELPCNLPKKTVSGYRKRQKSPQIPKPSTSYKYVKELLSILVILCAIAAAIFGGPYLTKLFENFQETYSRTQPAVANIIQNLKNDFAEQPPMTFKVISSALRRVTEPDPKAPAIILLLAEQGAEDIAGRFARKIADSVSSTNNVVVVSGHSYDSEDYDVSKKEIDDLLTENLREDRLEAVLVERLDSIPPQAAIIFHTYCDHENAPFKRVVYLMTIASTKTQLKSLEPKDWDTIVHEHLSKVWSKGGNDQISSLLSRLTVSVAAIVPGE